MKGKIKKTSKLINIITCISILMLVSLNLNGITVKAYEKVRTFRVGNFTYEEVLGTITLKEYNGPAVRRLIIPGRVNGKNVQDIGNARGSIFKNGKTIKYITVEEGVEEISATAFEGCKNLREINLPASLRDIENSDSAPFEGCSRLSKITVAGGNKFFYTRDGVLFSRQDNAMFYYPSGRTQKTYRVPEGIRLIQRFGYNPYLEKVILPRSASKIGHMCFVNVPNLKSITASEGMKKLVGMDQFHRDSKVKIIAYQNSFLWKYAKKQGIKYANRLVKAPLDVKSEKTATGIQISWKRNMDATGYIIYRSSSRNGMFSRAGGVKKFSQVKWTDRKTVKGKTYFYKVRAYREVAGEKILSKESITVHKKR